MEILSKAEVLKRISSIKKRSGSLREDIQSAAIGAMCHAMDHGDLTLASKLVNAVSVSNQAQLRAYFVEFMPVRNVKGKGFVKIKGKNGYRVTDAMDACWDDFNKADKAEPSYNALSDIKSLVKAIENRIVKADEAGDEHMQAVYEELLAIAAK